MYHSVPDTPHFFPNHDGQYQCVVHNTKDTWAWLFVCIVIHRDNGGGCVVVAVIVGHIEKHNTTIPLGYGTVHSISSPVEVHSPQLSSSSLSMPLLITSLQ
mmetsp:Transcript_38672/g.41935  ORF Transcript_38672/g.41935 Transcript_38672/m.41935 type:complete len:101 (+) Transcript_38672:780-1082(+)